MTTIKIEVEGLAQLTAQLQSLGLAADDVIEDVIFDLATDTHAFAVQGIQGGPKSGRTYQRGGVTHQASAPGEYPATDRGRLVSGVRIEQASPLDIRVGTNVMYGPMLEFGTSRMAARPWLVPSFERAKIGVAAELRARLEARV